MEDLTHTGVKKHITLTMGRRFEFFFKFNWPKVNLTHLSTTKYITIQNLSILIEDLTHISIKKHITLTMVRRIKFFFF